MDFFLFSFVPNMFLASSLSSKGVPNSPHFNPICFAQSLPFLTYIGGPKEEAFHLSIESSILGSLHVSIFIFLKMYKANENTLDITKEKTKANN